MKWWLEFRDELLDFWYLFLFWVKKCVWIWYLIVMKRIGVRVIKEFGRDYRKSDWICKGNEGIRWGILID